MNGKDIKAKLAAVANASAPAAVSPKSAKISTPDMAVEVKRPIVGGDSSVSVRKISNGYIVRESQYDGRNFQEVETFTPEAPTIEIKD